MDTGSNTVHCIAKPETNESWCGQDRGMLEPRFIGIDQAVMAKQSNQGFFSICNACNKAIIAVLVHT